MTALFNEMMAENKEGARDPHLLDMPNVVMSQVLKNLELRSIFCLRKVCHDLRTSIDEIKPDLHLETIRFQVPISTSSLDLYIADQPEFRKESYKNGLYKPRTGFEIWNDPREECSEVSMDDIKVILKYQKTVLKDLEINTQFHLGSEVIKYEEMYADINELIENIKNLLGNREQPLQVAKLSLQLNELSEGYEILKLIDSKTLEKINIRKDSCCHEPYWTGPGTIEMKFDGLEELEQWKKTKELTIIGNFILTPLESFQSFSKVFLHIRKTSVETLNAVKKIFIASPNLTCFYIESNDLRTQENEIITHFGSIFTYQDETMPDSLCRRNRISGLKIWTRKWSLKTPENNGSIQITLRLGLGDSIDFLKVQSNISNFSHKISLLYQ